MNSVRTTFLGMFLGFIFLLQAGFATCLNEEQTSLINDLAEELNLSSQGNINLFSIFETSCQNARDELENFNVSMHQEFFDYRNQTDSRLDILENKSSDPSEQLQSLEDKLTSLLYLNTNELWNQTVKRDEFQRLNQSLKNDFAAFSSGLKLQEGALFFWGGLAMLGAGLIYLVSKSRSQFPYIFGRIPVIGRFMKKRPQKRILEEETEDASLDTKAEISDMRDFILKQDNFSAGTQKKVFERYLDGQIETKKEIMEEMRLFDGKENGTKKRKGKQV